MGATISTFSTDDVADLGRFSERWRFGVDQFAKPRASAFGADIAADSEEPWASQWANAENEAPSGLEPLTVNPGKPTGEIFQQVPFSCVDRSWKVCGRFKWKRQEPIPVLESRASLFAVKHLLRSCHSFNKRHLILSDSISAVCALDRGRGRSFKMRRVTQQIGALILASNTSFSYRWIPSEWNPADGPSRGSRFASVPSRFPDSHDTQVPADWNRTVSSQEDIQHQEEGNSRAFKKDTRLGLIDGLEVGQEEGEGRYSAGGWKSPRCFGGAELQEKVRRVLGEVPKTSTDEVHCQFPAGDGRSEVGSPSGCDVRGRRRLGAGSVHGGGSSIQVASCKIPPSDEDAQDSSGHARLAQDGPPKVEASPTLGGCLSHDEVLHAKSDDPRSPYDGTVLCVLSSSGGGDKAQGDGSGGSSGKANELDTVVNSSASSGGVGILKNLGIRRVNHVRRGGDDAHSSGSGKVEKDRSKTCTRSPVHSDRGPAQEGHGDCWTSNGGDQYRASSPLSVEARRGLTRFRPQEKKARRDSKKRSVESLRKCEEVRERRTPEPIAADVAKASIEGRNGRSKRHQGNPPIPALNPHRSLATPVFLEIFSGCGHLASSVARYTGWPVLLWDISLGAEYDLRSPSKRRMIRNWVRTGLVRAFHLGTPCESFSRARDVPPGPPPLRSNEYPLGLSDLKPGDVVKVMNGNLFMRFSASLLQLALLFNIAATMENPQCSRIWLCPPLKLLFRKSRVRWYVTHFCAWGRPFKKPTGFLAVNLTLHHLEVGRCHSSKRGICAFTNCKHVPLCGQDSQGRWLTKLAQPYPIRMCNALAKDFSDYEVSRIAENFSSHF